MFNTPWELIKDIRDRNLSDTCFVIGGGPSLFNYLPDPSVLDGKAVITTNNAYKLFKNPLLCHFSDGTWYHWWKKEIDASIKNGKVFTTVSPSNNRPQVIYRRSEIYEFISDSRSGGITILPGRINGNNAGHQAINLAVHCMFSNIILLGFDMDPKSPQSHWHKEHKRDTNRNNYKNTMIPGMNKIAKQQEQLNFKVYNANPESNLKCFDFTDLKEWL